MFNFYILTLVTKGEVIAAIGALLLFISILILIPTGLDVWYNHDIKSLVFFVLAIFLLCAASFIIKKGILSIKRKQNNNKDIL